MTSVFRAVALAAAGMGVLACVQVPASAAESAVSGTVTANPGMPGPQRDSDASGKPMPGVEVELRGTGGAVVAHAKTDDKGAFRIPVGAGQYEIRVNISRIASRCRSQSVQVVDGQVAHVDIACDSGMR